MEEKKTWWTYERLQEDGTIKTASEYLNDFDGKLTGHIVFGVKQWLDENPEEARRLGWVKHIQHRTKDIAYNHQSQYLMKSHRIIDEYTYEDVWHVLDKTPEMMRDQELGLLDMVANDEIVFGGII